ncbi:hypothetical protein A2630_01690 [Candidatus Woesebacteria bacterium RIFCSPHIGHO2_01_FULL_44_10]|uniref:PIN domain-containing protein n=1 Tax=Candidatus Woesebacteria bacterium RIFCSPLOWO2_01_FULL_44_14 TaxID=1802525 RepID=A0A1F8BYD0_9BACT|nr:MAG: hypothetical protein A2630_01690 [Candidatus Woesebacteria bacterium RIFCSPHIGHO2_01_FULL_44_10]OGM54296.1 MAG: hypothetical protein A3F62_02990 [Candidatus Woesebacteria bacterium RIFCSPHIGHO2_12_FULL_44_11]OGM68589.1 MAG: hypothetical protein A2975_00680 [Candidatus Woesebacteria bacterium RIFCSPLOWO2_01_FULL_44_14]
MIFIDADAFIGIYKKSDPHHKNAVRISENLQEDGTGVVTSWDVVDEVATKLSYQVARKIAIQFLDDLGGGNIKVVFVDSKLAKKAQRIFKKQTSKRVSLTDCTNMAIMREMKIKTIFSFDIHYEQNGFKFLG